MTFREAADYVLPWGQHKGRSLDSVAETDEGLKYLDWLRGRVTKDLRTKEALDAYLGDKTISAELDRILGRVL